MNTSSEITNIDFVTTNKLILFEFSHVNAITMLLLEMTPTDTYTHTHTLSFIYYLRKASG